MADMYGSNVSDAYPTIVTTTTRVREDRGPSLWESLEQTERLVAQLWALVPPQDPPADVPSPRPMGDLATRVQLINEQFAAALLRMSAGR